MAISMYKASVPAFVHMLSNLAAILQKAEGYAGERGIEETVLINSRLAPDMFPLVRQVQIATDIAKRGGSRLAGQEPQSVADTESTFAELIDRIDNANQFLQSLQPEAIDGAEDRVIQLQLGDEEVTFDGMSYLLHFILPNMYFHITTAYNILRHNGLEIGKRDFLGQI